MKPTKICIVDDEAYGREVLSDALESEGYELISLSSGDDLLAYLQMNAVDIILLDVMMPDKDGFAICRQIKENHNYRHIPIILITALSGRSSLLKGLDAGADEFLSKPVNVLELRARVRTMLRIKMQYDALQNALTLREDLTNMVVHDMKHPITSAMAHCYLIQNIPNLTENISEGLEVITAQLRRLLAFADDILTVAKMEDGKFSLDLSPVDLRQLILSVVADHQSLASMVNLKLSSDVPNEFFIHRVDIEILRRVIENLLSNALKYSTEESTITVRLAYLESNGHHPQIQVFDSGPGIDPKYRDLIFDKFAITNLKRAGVPQTGIGLAFSRRAIEAHGGKLYVTDNQPHGSIFTIELYSSAE